MHYPMMDDTDPLLIRAGEAGNWNSIHEPPRLTPPAHLMFDPDTVAENTMRLDELESKMEQALEIQEAWVQQRLADLDRHHEEKIKQIQQRVVDDDEDLSESMGLAVVLLPTDRSDNPKQMPIIQMYIFA